MNGVLVQKKDGDSCTINLFGHSCNVQTSTKFMISVQHVRHSFSSKPNVALEGEFWSCETFILIKKQNVVLEGG